MRNRLPDKWVTLEEAAQAVHAPVSLIQQWAGARRIATREDPATHALLVSADDVEDIAEEEAWRLLAHRALAHEDQD